MTVRARVIATLAAAALIAAAVIVPAAPAAAAPSCSAFKATLYDQIKPSTGAQTMTIRGDVANAHFAAGYTEVRDPQLAAASAAGTSIKAVHVLWKEKYKDRFFTHDTAEIKRLVQTQGFVDKGVAFYAGTSAASCLVSVWSYVKAGVHRYSASKTEQAQLRAAGWVQQKVRFYLGTTPPAAFSIAVIPDTQQEVLQADDPRMTNRNAWIATTRAALGTQFVLHTGDIVNWDTPDHVQYQRAQASLPALGDLPYALAAGNHDTAAVGPGGSAAPGQTWVLVRDTATYNTYLGASSTISGRFEAGHAENSYALFSAGGREWMALTLELWPRPEVVQWAAEVVAAHPHHNVIVSTHAYLTSGGSISTSNGGYGATSPKYLFDNLIKLYPNIKVVVSGHTGKSAYRKDTGVNGNTIMSYVLCMHSDTTNPMRMLEINVTAGTLASYVYAPLTKTGYSSYRAAPQKMTWVR